MSEQTYITWDAEKLERFKRAFEQSQGNVFTFEGHQFMMGYAKYLILYLEQKMKGVQR